MLDNYKTNPANEIRKINAILRRTHCSISLWNALNDCYLESDLCSYEPSLDNFYKNCIVNNYLYDEIDEFEVEVIRYRLFVELLLELLEYPSSYNEYGEFVKDINQLKLTILEGLKKLGYGLKDFNGKKVTYKCDVVAETIAVSNNDYANDIFDYLISKSISEKETALTNLSIKLEALKPKDTFMKNTRDYIQMMRHREERKKTKQYSWFFEKEEYEKNLDDLFRILICYVAHDGCLDIINLYDSKCHVKQLI